MPSLWLDRAGALASDDFLTAERADVVVAGAGITGLTTAVLLARAGKRVVVLEARSVGAATTGGTTGKLSLLQGRVLGRIRHHHGDAVLRAYAQANLEGQRWLVGFLDEKAVAYERRPAWTYAEYDDALDRLAAEHAATVAAGIDARRADAVELPFRTAGAILLDGQVQFDPLPVLHALAAELRERSGRLVLGARVVGASTAKARRGGPVEIATDHGTVTADQLILASGTPFLGNGARFAFLEPSRAFGAAFAGPEAETGFLQGMYLSVDQPTRSLRSVPALPGPPESGGADDGGPRLVAVEGGARGGTPGWSARRDALLGWVRERFPGTTPTHVWAAQDYRSVTAVPLVGTLPGTSGRIFVATGYGKWGLTNGVAAGLAISSDVLDGGEPSWARQLYGARLAGSDAADAAAFNLGVAGRLAAGWARSLVRDGWPVGRCRVDGEEYTVSGVCTHLGGALRWNEAEKSWDCPLHGSRFAADGTLLEGPATRSLRRY
ncbi:FAD-dependent oxidoreductase [Sinomonas sp. ASV322]|uniref:FAD-dependent oxidoreductase n=1 Tax=Sinomonas sp. ASV322 TaxID=3041920 RepID=UPI0027DE7BBD|nr:FAD-dependent oxidoreductase [Sinomonas sp. ASV322]MDQ4503507.1 FAD-dependent oxidoreductase [Sinomonas sp. ASV322]